MHVNFSSLPEKTVKKSTGPLGNAMIATGVTLAILLLFGLVGYFGNDSNREELAGLVSIFILFVFLGVILKSAGIFIGQFRKEKRAMQLFAVENHWEFDGKRRRPDPELDGVFEEEGRTRNGVTQRYAISGDGFFLSGLLIIRNRWQGPWLHRNEIGQTIVIKTSARPRGGYDRTQFKVHYASDGAYVLTTQFCGREQIKNLFYVAGLTDR